MAGAGQARPRGFTLIEFTLVFALAAVLAGLAAPALARVAAANAVAAQAAEFMAALRFARVEAVKRGETVSVCAAAPAPAPAETCLAAPPLDWAGGWLVFVDRGERGVREPADPLLRVQPPLRQTGGAAGTRRALSFSAAGFATDAASRVAFAPPPLGDADAVPARLVCVSKQGRPRLSSAAVCE